MTTPLSTDSEKIKKALKLLQELIELNPDTPVNTLLQKAIVQYDLSPKDGDALYHCFKDSQ